MLGLFAPRCKKVSPIRTRSARLRLEQLESRDTPSTLTLSVSAGVGSYVTLSGQLTNTSTVANQAISIYGALAATTYTDTNGDYSVTLQNQSGGTVYSQTQDGASNITEASLPNPSQPMSNLTLSITYGQGTTITLSGTLSNATNVANQGITISGMASGTATTDANGNFSVTLQGIGTGAVYAQTTDGSSNIATVIITDTPPNVFNFLGGEDTGNSWEFTGTVTYNCSFTSMPVQLEGPGSIGTVNTTATGNGTMSNGVCTGTFDTIIQLNGMSSDNGNIVATATDPWGGTDDAIFFIHQTGT